MDVATVAHLGPHALSALSGLAFPGGTLAGANLTRPALVRADVDQTATTITG